MASESFLKALRWLVLAQCAVIGTSAFIIADQTGSVRPVMIGVVTYGVIYVMSYFWKDFRKKILLYSIIVFLILSLVSPYIPMVLFVLFGTDMNGYDPFYLWAATVAVIGLPVMTLVFKYLD